MNMLINIETDEIMNNFVSGRELHMFLEVKTAYKDWFPRMCTYGFEENQDYRLVAQKRATNNPKNPWTEVTDHLMSLDMAKQIAMIQRNEKGKQAREYFLQVEKAWNTPEMFFGKALQMANKLIEKRTTLVTGKGQVYFVNKFLAEKVA